MGRFEHVDRQAGFVATGGFFQLHGSGGCEVDMFFAGGRQSRTAFPVVQVYGGCFQTEVTGSKGIVFRMIVSDMNPFGT